MLLFVTLNQYSWLYLISRIVLQVSCGSDVLTCKYQIKTFLPQEILRLHQSMPIDQTLIRNLAFIIGHKVLILATSRNRKKIKIKDKYNLAAAYNTTECTSQTFSQPLLKNQDEAPNTKLIKEHLLPIVTTRPESKNTTK